MLSRTANRTLRRLALLLVVAACSDNAEPTSVGEARLDRFGPFLADWSTAVAIENFGPGAVNFSTAFLDGCPTPSRDGKLFFMASRREGSAGIDIWVSSRERETDPWGAPVNVGAPINTAGDDFCPLLLRDGRFLFVSTRPEGNCGKSDIYISRRHPDGTFETPVNLGCGVNSAEDEAGPIEINEPGSGPVLYFSSTRSGAGDIYRATWDGGRYRDPQPVAAVNTPFVEGQPFAREDGRELFFFSNRPGSIPTPAGPPSNDIYMSTRARATDAWGAPQRLDERINSSAQESRPSLSPDASVLYFGSTRTGAGDIHASRRTQTVGN